MRSIIALAAVASAGFVGTAQGAPQDPVWFWFSTCGGPSMVVEVQLDSRILHRATVPLCRRSRAATESPSLSGRLEFTWIPDRAIAWDSERPAEASSIRGMTLKLDIWQAGADQDGVLLGVSVSSRDRVLLNTVHVAHPAKRDEARLAGGVVVRTYPAAP